MFLLEQKYDYFKVSFYTYLYEYLIIFSCDNNFGNYDL